MIINMPYGHDFLTADIDDAQINGVLSPKLFQYQPDKSGPQLVRQALLNL